MRQENAKDMSGSVTIESLRQAHPCLMELKGQRLERVTFLACLANYMANEGRLLDRPSLTFWYRDEARRKIEE